MVYCWEGFKKIFTKTQKINTVLDSLEVLHQQDVMHQEVIIIFNFLFKF